MTAPRRAAAPAATIAGMLAALLAASCVPASPSLRPGDVRYVVGEPYAMGGVWSYPREDYGLAGSGLAAILPDAPRHRRTADGEVYDPAAPTAAHRTLQLPAVLRVWNLDTGRELRVRVIDRGPEQPGRVVGLSRRAAELLGARPGEPARVRIAVDAEMSRAAVAGLAGADGPLLAIATAPVGAVEREQLAPPPGAGAAAGASLRVPVAAKAVATPAPPPAASPLLRLPEEVIQRGAVASRLMVEAGTFHRRDLAERRAALIAGRVETDGAGRQPMVRVRSGPFATAAEADRALEAAFRRGIPNAMTILD